MTELKLEILQERPFASLHEEAMLNLLRTSDCLNRAFHLRLKSYDITSTQYNVLRILRGAGNLGLTCSGIGARMLTAVPDITRLLNRLKLLGYIGQRRDEEDRRVVWTTISTSGLELLANMDPMISRLPGELLDHLSHEELATFVALLEKARERAQKEIDPERK